MPSRRKKSLRSYSVDFDFLAIMRFDMTFDVTLRDDSSFGKLTNSSIRISKRCVLLMLMLVFMSL